MISSPLLSAGVTLKLMTLMPSPRCSPYLSLPAVTSCALEKLFWGRFKLSTIYLSSWLSVDFIIAVKRAGRQRDVVLTCRGCFTDKRVGVRIRAQQAVGIFHPAKIRAKRD